MLTDDEMREVRECTLAILKAFDGYDAFIVHNALIWAATEFILAQDLVGAMKMLEEVTQTLRKHVIFQISAPETEGTAH
jgi:hypothetical protein